MTGEGERADDFDICCMLCNKPITDEDEVHFIASPGGFDIDVMCGECLARTRQMSGGQGTGIEGLDEGDAL